MCIWNSHGLEHSSLEWHAHHFMLRLWSLGNYRKWLVILSSNAFSLGNYRQWLVILSNAFSFLGALFP